MHIYHTKKSQSKTNAVLPTNPGSNTHVTALSLCPKCELFTFPITSLLTDTWLKNREINMTKYIS